MDDRHQLIVRFAARTALLGVGLGCCALGGWGAHREVPPPDPSPVRALRAALRPLALPLAWRAWDDAGRATDRSRQFSRARVLMALLPEWVDGHLLFASQEALQPSDDPTEAADRVAASLGWMERIATRERDRGDAADAALAYGAMAALVRSVAMDDDRAKALAAVLGAPAEELAFAYLERAAAVDPSQAAREHALFGEIAVLRAVLRSGDRARARRMLARALEGLADVRDRETAARWRDSLERLDRALESGRAADLEALREDPMVGDLLPPR